MLLCCLATVSQAKRVPNFELKDISGKPAKVSDLHGSIVVLSFWATWCGPCKEELPRLSKLSQRPDYSNVRFIAVSMDGAKDRAKIEPFVKAQGIDMTIWVGGDLDLLQRVGLGNVLPATLIIDQQGEVIRRIMGEAKDEDITTSLDWLLHERQGTAPELVLKRY
jgi:thiol-disulfide isomerase/thioredoxin